MMSVVSSYWLRICQWLISCACLVACHSKLPHQVPADPNLKYKTYEPKSTDMVISRSEYANKLHGFWLGQCIANWTGLVTEMDKIGNIGEIQTGEFYTRHDWGKPDQPSIWGEGVPSDLSETIGFVYREPGESWGADDDTDLEYMYQHLLYKHATYLLTPDQIREGWLRHIRHEEENFLWVSNQKAFDLMKNGILPPDTSLPESNEHTDMIDAQLTTEIFGLFAPTRPNHASAMAELAIKTTARNEAALIAEFYVRMYSRASLKKPEESIKHFLQNQADQVSKIFPVDTYPWHMYEMVKSFYQRGYPWEQTRDSLYIKYQVNQENGYDITSCNLYCNGCFAAGINFGASMVSLFYGEGNLSETIKIGTLAGWDSDNPTATWGGLIGFILGKEGVENEFGRTFSNEFDIHRTRVNFPIDSTDNFDRMAREGLFIVDRVIQEYIGGGVDLNLDLWYIPAQ